MRSLTLGTSFSLVVISLFFDRRKVSRKIISEVPSPLHSMTLLFLHYLKNVAQTQNIAKKTIKDLEIKPPKPG